MIRTVAAMALAVEVAVHGYLTPDHLEEVPYLGVAFGAAALVCGLAMVMVLADRPTGWLLAGATCAAMASAFAVSRIVGLPGYHEAWSSDHALGLWSLPPEALVVLLAVVRLRITGSPAASSVAMERPPVPATSAGQAQNS